MTSLRHNTADEHEPREAYLDAARACILEVGWKRTTLTEVARRAGVSRMTIYRTWADMPTLLGDLMTREWGAIAARATEAGDLTDPDALAETALAMVRTLRENDLFVRIVEVDPELILPYLISRRGRSQELIVTALAEALTSGQAAGTIRAGDPLAMARSLVLVLHGFVISSQTMLDDAVGEGALDAELRHLLRQALLP